MGGVGVLLNLFTTYAQSIDLRLPTCLSIVLLSAAQLILLSRAGAAQSWTGKLLAVVCSALAMLIAVLTLLGQLSGKWSGMPGLVSLGRWPDPGNGPAFRAMSSEVAFGVLCMSLSQLLGACRCHRSAFFLAGGYCGLAVIGMAFPYFSGVIFAADSLPPQLAYLASASLAPVAATYALISGMLLMLSLSILSTRSLAMTLNWQLDRSATVGFLLGTTLLLSVGALATSAHYLGAQAESRLAAAENLYGKASRTYGDLVAQFSSIYNYLRTGKLNYLNAYLAAIDQTSLGIDELRAAIAAHERLAVVYRPFETQVLNLMRSSQEISDILSRGAASAQSEALVDDVQVKLDDLQQTFHQVTVRHRENTQRLHAEKERINQSSFVITAIGVLMSLSLYSIVIYRINSLTAERNRVENELEEYREHLEEMVSQRTEELGAAIVAAESANRAKSAFLSNMSHEIRTPMNAIIGMTHLIGGSNVDPKTAQRLEKVLTAANHLLNIIDNILDLTKIESGEHVIESTSFSPREMLKKTLDICEAQAAKKQIEVSSSVSEAIPDLVLGDSAKISQIALNLVNNAIKFSNRGRVLVEFSCFVQSTDKMMLELCVSDQGVGIPEEHLEMIFQPFKQADDSITRRFGGTGLGLTISRQFARLMGGDIEVSSQEGVGSVFTARFEVGRIAAEASLSPVEGDEAVNAAELLRRDFTGRRVLLVEDDPMNQEVIGGLLESVGLLYDLASNGREALVRLAENTPYALVLMDLQMPELGGLETTRMIRADPAFPASLVIVAMTANVFSDDREACRQAGMNGFVGKPVDPKAFYHTLLHWLSSIEA